MTWSAGISEQESDILTRTVEQVLKHLYLRDPMALIDPPLYRASLWQLDHPALVQSVLLGLPVVRR